ncbi:MAG: hypothetical protein VB141_13130 [Burkholderia gladioli]
MNHRDYTYYRNGTTGYMAEVIDYFRSSTREQMHILDVPSGSGVFARELQSMGHQVTKADIHNEEGSVYANMELKCSSLTRRSMQ